MCRGTLWLRYSGEAGLHVSRYPWLSDDFGTKARFVFSPHTRPHEDTHLPNACCQTSLAGGSMTATRTVYTRRTRGKTHFSEVRPAFWQAYGSTRARLRADDGRLGRDDLPLGDCPLRPLVGHRPNNPRVGGRRCEEAPRTHHRCLEARAHALLCLPQIYGTVIIFWSFTCVQQVYQRLNPGFYFGSELTYCVLSLSAKLYLGLFLLINVVMTDGSVEQALEPEAAAAARLR